jgi:hypothetical protein
MNSRKWLKFFKDPVADGEDKIKKDYEDLHERMQVNLLGQKEFDIFGILDGIPQP